MNCSCFLSSRCLSHTAQSLGHSCPALCRVSVGLSNVLLGPRPSLPCLRRGSLLFVRQVHGYYGAVRLLRNVPTRCAAFRLFGPVSIRVGSRSSRGLPVLVHVVSQRARVLRLRRASRPLAIFVTQLYCLPLLGTGSALWFILFGAQSPGPPMPLSTLRRSPRGGPRKTQGQDGVAVSFPVGLFHPLQHAGLARRTPRRKFEIALNPVFSGVRKPVRLRPHGFSTALWGPRSWY